MNLEDIKIGDIFWISEAHEPVQAEVIYVDKNRQEAGTVDLKLINYRYGNYTREKKPDELFTTAKDCWYSIYEELAKMVADFTKIQNSALKASGRSK